jgi:ribosomal protein L35
MGKAGREWVRQEFSFERFKERMEHILGKWETKERRNSRK